jgi:succinate-semialdehyde dehydrogenase/glutarate-semialdehyde dehydrogenase
MKLKDPALFRQECYIDGTWVTAKESFEVLDPADGKVVGRVPSLGQEATRQTVAAASAAYPGWKALTAKERSVIMKRWHALIVEHKDDLAMIMTREQGKPLAEATGEVLSGASYIEWFAEEAKRVYGDTIPTTHKGKRIIVLKEPVGVCAAITPWNFPSSNISRKAAPALAAGCPVIVKPAPQTPLSALALAELADRAGFPRGVFNVITGPAAEIGGELTRNPLVRKLSFTGSTPVGKLLMAACAGTVKKISLELGGHAPFIVFDDADLDQAVAGALANKYRNSGQTCVCANQFLVQEGVYEAFASKLAAAVRSEFQVGPGMERRNNQGPLIDLNAVIKVEEQIHDALEKGAKILAGGKRVGEKGFFFEPTVLVDVTSEMRIAREETFGPVAPILVFKNEADAVRMANDSQYGLASYFYSRDIGRAWRVTEALEYGMVGVNTGSLSSEAAPFGGMKESGIGREGSKYGIDEYLEIKYMCIGGLDL